MKVRVYPSPLSGKIGAVASKSYAHRMLIAAALASGGLSFGDSDDAYYTAHALEALGFQAKFADKSVHYGCFSRPIGQVDVRVGESGSTLRFLLPLAAALGVDARFVTAGRLGSRPMSALIDALSAHGVTASADHVSGQLTAGLYELDATVSSQFVTGLLMALPLLKRDSEIRLMGKAVSAPYIRITLEVLRAAGIEIREGKSGFFVPGGQRYHAIAKEVPGDFSGAAFYLVAGALGEGIRMTGLDLLSAQGDKAVVDVLQSAGAIVTSGEELVVKRGDLRAFTADIGETPDLAPILSVLAAYAVGESRLRHVSRLRDKESDRLFAIRDMLGKCGIFTQEIDDDLVIRGGTPKGAVFDSFGDHRMAMSEGILAAFAEGESVISDRDCVKKSYPTFWKDFSRVGGKYEVER